MLKPHKRAKRSYLLCLYVCILLFSFAPSSFSQGDLRLPPLPAPEEYGDVAIDRTSTEKNVIPVIFSHWVHRAKYTCRVCHGELEFSMKTNETAILCRNGEKDGKYCTVCHNGTISFAPRDEKGENCKLCHNANTGPNRDKFYAMQKKLPRSKWGNEIDWMKALNDGLIKPKESLSENFQSLHLDRTLELRAEMSGIPPAVFPHKEHVKWLDCSNCHPDIFNIKKKTTAHFSMSRILNNEFCGVCHLKIAFPQNDCKRCHPGIRHR